MPLQSGYSGYSGATPRLTNQFLAGVGQPQAVQAVPTMSTVQPAPSVNLSNMALNGNGSLVPDVFAQRTNDLSALGNQPGGGTGFGWNLNSIGTGIQGIAAIGGLYNAFQANKLAKEQFAFTKEVTNTNLNNQIKSFNTSMEDRALARARLDGREDTAGYTKDYMDKNQLTRSK